MKCSNVWKRRLISFVVLATIIGVFALIHWHRYGFSLTSASTYAFFLVIALHLDGSRSVKVKRRPEESKNAQDDP